MSFFCNDMFPCFSIFTIQAKFYVGVFLKHIASTNFHLFSGFTLGALIFSILQCQFAIDMQKNGIVFLLSVICKSRLQKLSIYFLFFQ